MAPAVTMTVIIVEPAIAADEAVRERHEQEQHELFRVGEADPRLRRKRRRDERESRSRRRAARRSAGTSMRSRRITISETQQTKGHGEQRLRDRRSRTGARRRRRRRASSPACSRRAEAPTIGRRRRWQRRWDIRDILQAQ